jgi:hypothetical protein
MSEVFTLKKKNFLPPPPTPAPPPGDLDISGRQWLFLVMLATWEAENVRGQPGK